MTCPSQPPSLLSPSSMRESWRMGHQKAEPLPRSLGPPGTGRRDPFPVQYHLGIQIGCFKAQRWKGKAKMSDTTNNVKNNICSFHVFIGLIWWKCWCLIFLPGKHPLFRSLNGWWGSPSQPRWRKQYLTCLSKISMSICIAVVPHNAVETYRRAWLLWITDGRANPLMDRKVVGVLFLGVVAMVVAVTYHNCWM